MSASFHSFDDLSENYELISKIGRGAIGDVILVKDLKTKEKKAIKVMEIVNMSRYDDDESNDNIEKLRNEAEIMEKLDHPYLLKFYECFQTANHYCIVSEYCDENLLKVLTAYSKKGTRPSFDLMIEWFYKLAQAIQYLHDNKIIHRDIKPENILFKDNEIKVADFGESREILHTLTRMTKRGTPPYMAPELIKKELCSKKTDVWSLGCVFYEIYFIKQAFNGKNDKELEENILNRRVKSLDSEKNDFTDLINNMLNLDPKKRFSINDVLSHRLFANYLEASERVDKPELVELCSSRGNNYALIERLIKIDHANYNYQDNHGSNALMKASDNGRNDVVELLLKNKAIIDAKDNYGCTALMFASRNGHDNIVDLLIKKQAKVNEIDDEGWTALMWASLEGHRNVVKLLIKNKADVNKKDKFGLTALMWASRNGHKNVVETLVENKAIVNEKSTEGTTALMLASLNGHNDIVKFLVDNKAKVNEKNESDFTALFFASTTNEQEVIKYLKSKGANE